MCIFLHKTDDIQFIMSVSMDCFSDQKVMTPPRNSLKTQENSLFAGSFEVVFFALDQ